jgi:hypothetical protein
VQSWLLWKVLALCAGQAGNDYCVSLASDRSTRGGDDADYDEADEPAHIGKREGASLSHRVAKLVTRAFAGCGGIPMFDERH